MSENAVIGTGSCWFGRTRREGRDNYKEGKCTMIVHPAWPPPSAWRPEGIPLSEMPEEARRICEDFDRKAAEAANGVFAAEDKVNNKENGK